MEPEVIAGTRAALADEQMPAIVDEMAREQAPRVWQAAPPPIRRAVVYRGPGELPRSSTGWSPT